MKNRLIPLTALAGGAAALALRLLQLKTGYEADTGLPAPGSGIALAVLLAILAAVLVLFSLRLPAEAKDGPVFPRDFATENTGLLALTVAGLFLIAASGALDIFAGAASNDIPQEEGLVTLFILTPQVRILLGALALISAVSLLPAATACRKRPEETDFSGTPMLAAPICMVVRLVLAYRLESMNPVLGDYYLSLLALVFLTLTFYRLSSFAYQAGQTRRFVLYAAGAAVTCVAALADSHALPDKLLYLGGALASMGFLLLRLEGPEVPAAENCDGKTEQE